MGEELSTAVVDDVAVVEVIEVGVVELLRLYSRIVLFLLLFDDDHFLACRALPVAILSSQSSILRLLLSVFGLLFILLVLIVVLDRLLALMVLGICPVVPHEVFHRRAGLVHR